MHAVIGARGLVYTNKLLYQSLPKLLLSVCLHAQCSMTSILTRIWLCIHTSGSVVVYTPCHVATVVLFAEILL